MNQQIHMNKPQLEAQMIDAQDQVHLHARGNGKSEFIIAPRAYKQASSMPRCGIGMLGASYMQLLDRTLPPMLKTWNAWGLRKDVDYWLRRMPPKEFSSVMPYWSPEVADHAMFFRSWYWAGYKWKFAISVFHLIGQDRPGTSNSKSMDGLIGDEAKLLKWDRVENESFLANRGNEAYFGHTPYHHGLCFTSDMPADKATLDKLLNFEKLANEPENLERIQLILGVQYELYLERNKANPSQEKINKYEMMLWQLRKYTVHFSEASTLMNAEVLGMEFIQKLKRTLPENIFRLSILNIRPNSVEHGFYPDLFDHHFTYENDYSFIDGYEPDKERQKDCRKDGDIMKNQPLIVANDWGARINTLVVGQKRLNELRVLNELYVLHPDTLPELAKAFHEYYRFMPHRDIIIPYDHTATGTYPGSKLSLIDSFVDTLEDKYKWNVERVYIGETPEPMRRFNLSSYCLRGGHPDYIDVSFNAENCQYLKTSMQQCGIDDKNPRGWRKDKSLEKDKEADQREAPHFSDAFDTLLWYANQKEITGLGLTGFGSV